MPICYCTISEGPVLDEQWRSTQWVTASLLLGTQIRCQVPPTCSEQVRGDHTIIWRVQCGDDVNATMAGSQQTRVPGPHFR